MLINMVQILRMSKGFVTNCSAVVVFNIGGSLLFDGGYDRNREGPLLSDIRLSGKTNLLGGAARGEK